MKRKLLLGLLFLIGVAVGQTNKSLSVYGCTSMDVAYDNTTSSTPIKVCIVYDPNMDRHFILAATTHGASLVEEK